MSARPYRSPLGFSRLTAAALGGVALLEGVQGALALVAWLGVAPAEVGWAVVALVGGLATLGAMLLLAAYSWRVAENVRALDPDGEPPRSWLAALGWFLPVANLYVPFDALSSTWSASAMRHPGESQGPDRRFELFWGTWVASILIGRIFGGGETVGLVDVVAATLGLVSCTAGALVVHRIATVQSETAAHLQLG